MPMPQPAHTGFTYADYRHWPENERWELIDGQPHAMAPAPSVTHQTLAGQIYRQLDEAFEGTPCRVLIAPCDVLLPDRADEADDAVTTVVQPDVFVVCDPDKLRPAHVRGAPDWIVEVLSPATAGHDQIRKKQLYERAGVREYWLVHPVDRIAIRYARVGNVFAPPEIVELIGELASSAFPGVAIRWQPIIDKLPAEPLPQASPPRA